MVYRMVMGALAVSLVAATGCVNDPGGTNESEPVNLRISMSVNHAFEAGFEDLFTAFQVDHPNVTFEVERVDFSAYYGSVSGSLTTDSNENDLVSLFGSWTCPLAPHLATVPEDVMSLEASKEIFFDATREGYECDGALVGMPQEYNLEYGNVLVNKQLFVDAGRTYPPAWSSFDDVLADAEAIRLSNQEQNKAVTGLHFLTGDGVPSLFLAGILQRGGDYWGPNHASFVFTSAEARASLQFLVDAANQHDIFDLAAPPADDPIRMFFAQNDEAMGYAGSWTIAQGQLDYPDFGAFGDTFSYHRLPPLVGTEHRFVADSGWGLVVPATSAHQELAWEFAKFATTTAAAAQWNITGGTVPATRASVDDAQVREALPWLSEITPLLQSGHYTGALPDHDTLFYDVILGHVTDAVLNRATVDDALQAIEAEANQTLE
jgi:ABC-type glycerol-3-phosphate transport system substrate-binding protein